MLPRLFPAQVPAASLAALAVLAGLALTAAFWGARAAPERPEVCMDHWDMPDLARYLEGRGLPLHLSPTWAGGSPRSNAFLTVESKTRGELYGLLKTRKAIHRWAGVVYGERSRNNEDREGAVALWADCGLRAGPFVFFGDPALLARIRTALSDANGSGPGPGGR